jgi:hypothetical protein
MLALSVFEWKCDTLLSIASRLDECRAWIVVMPRRYGKTEFLKNVAHVLEDVYDIVVLTATRRQRKWFRGVKAYCAGKTVFTRNTLLLVDDYDRCANHNEIMSAVRTAGGTFVATTSRPERDLDPYVEVLEYTE